MKLTQGLIVQSLSGRDKGTFLAVLSAEDTFAVVADGKARPIERPKRKSLKHLKLTDTTADMNNLTNKKLRSILRDFSQSKP